MLARQTSRDNHQPPCLYCIAPVQDSPFFCASHRLICALQRRNAGPTEWPAIQELPMFVSYILAKVQAYFRYRETIRELSLLSDRELTDLGIARFQIDSIARQGAAS
jgi:uncharacterized protein YjiS (DUF1127 family)